MSFTTLRLLDPSRCEPVFAAINDFIDAAYTEANIRAHRAHVYEYGLDSEAFSFALHCPGSPETDHLPGFRLDELPEEVARLTEQVVETLGLERGRVLWNVGRYCPDSQPLPPHFDGELFDFTPDATDGNKVHSGIRPREVALLTLRNETEACHTTLHDQEGKVLETRMRPGEMIVFDNVAYMHGVPTTGPSRAGASGRRWSRATTGWRAMEEGFDWDDARPLRPISFEQAIAKHDAFMAHDWPRLAEEAMARATIPFPRRFD